MEVDLLAKPPYAGLFPGELENKKQLLASRYFSNKKFHDQPKAVLLGGQPASGKTRLIAHLNSNTPTDFIIINGDTYRELHPRYEQIQAYYGQDAPNKTQPFSNSLVEFMKEECLRRKLSFIIEGTMRTFGVIESTAKQAHEHGFQVEAHVLAVHSDDSYLGIFQRYEGEMAFYGHGRFSPLHTHDEAYHSIPDNLQKANEQQLFDRICVYRRDKTDALQPTQVATKGEEVDFSALFSQTRQPLLSATEYSQKWDVIHQQALQRQEVAPNYLKLIADFCTKYSETKFI